MTKPSTSSEDPRGWGGGGTQAFLSQGCLSENKFQLPKKIE